MDSDDPTLSQYYTLLNGFGQVLVVDPDRRGMVAALQRGWESYRDNVGYAIGFMGDDHRPRTVGWDDLYIKALRKLGSGFVYGNDLFQYEAIPTQIAMTRDIPDTLGYLCPPEFDHLCVDVVWKDWGDAIGKIEYQPDTVVEHMHYLAAKSPFDQGYANVNNATVANHDAAAYQEYKTGRFGTDVEKLFDLIAPPKPPVKKAAGRPRTKKVDSE